jgi:hypothetical protein
LYTGYTLNPLPNSAYHEVVKRGWDLEERYHDGLRDTWATEKRQHEEFRIQMDLERKAVEEERRRRREEEIKKRAGISWEGLEAGEHCLRYGTREYTAILTHVPAGFDALEECRNIPIEVHGKFILPSRCEDQVRNPNSFIKYTHRSIGDLWASYWALEREL